MVYVRRDNDAEQERSLSKARLSTLGMVINWKEDCYTLHLSIFFVHILKFLQSQILCTPQVFCMRQGPPCVCTSEKDHIYIYILDIFTLKIL